MIAGVLSTDLMKNWQHVAAAFQSFEDRSDGRWTVPYLIEAVLMRQKQVWKVNDWQAVAITSVGPNAEYVTLEACYGQDHKEWYSELEGEIEAWAKSMGAKRMFGMARPGWTKAFRAQGYREIHREFVKEI